MTPPIQEPTTQRAVSGLGWGENQLARRPPPLPPAAGGSTICACLTWNYCTTNAFPDSTWRSVASQSAGDGYTDGFWEDVYTDTGFPGLALGTTFGTGLPYGVRLNTGAAAFAFGGVMFNESFSSSETLAISINLSGGVRRINTINGALGDLMYMVGAFVGELGRDVVGSNDITIEAWHNSTGKTIRDAMIQVVSTGAIDAGAWTNFSTGDCPP